MRKNKQGYKHWDFNTGSKSEAVTSKSIASAIVFRPGLVMMLLSITAGLLITYKVSAAIGFSLIIIVSFLVIYVFCQAGGRLRSRLACFYLLLGLLTLFVFLRAEANDRFNRLYSKEIIGSIIDIQGTVVSVPDLNEAGDDWSSVRLRLVNGCLIRLTGSISQLEFGDFISAKVVMELPAKETNPGGFSMRDLLLSHGIYTTGKIVMAEELCVLKKGGIWHRLRSAVPAKSAIRQAVRSFLDREQADLLLAIFVGDDNLLDPDVKIYFRRSGLAHLTSVSGSHISFVIMPISFLAGLMKLGKKQAAAVQILLLLIYGTITGWNTGAVRAVFMLSILIVLKAADRNYDAANSLGLVCACMIFHNIYIVMQMGFWLSFCAAAALTVFAVPCADWLRTIVLDKTKILLPDLVTHSLCAVVLLQFVMIPLTAPMNNEIFWLSWLYNMPAISLVSIICVLSVFVIPIIMISGYFLNTVASSFFTGLIGACAKAALDSPLKSLTWLAKAGSSSEARSSTADFSILVFMGGALLAAAFWLRYVQPKVFSFGKLPMWVGGVMFAAGLSIMYLTRLTSPEWTLYFLDVGQGDSLLMIDRRSSISILIDGGPENSGYYDIEPAMRSLGISKIDLAIVTHGHADHIYGVMELAELGLIEEIAVSHISVLAADRSDHSNSKFSTAFSKDDQGNDLSMLLINKCTNLSIPVQLLKKHDTITLPGDAAIFVLSPDAYDEISSVRKDQNEASLILEFEQGSLRTLLLADLTANQERSLMPEWKKADVIKVAHHGSRSTTGEPFVGRVLPRHAIISSGPNFYGHPSPDVINRLEDADCMIWRTDTSGCVIVDYFKNEARIKVYGR